MLSFVSFFLLAFTMLQGHSSSSSCHHEKTGKVVKYVQGGACDSGNGSKKHPYATLAEAQADTTWDVLIVLPSPTALDGGITLRSGTKLIGGGEDPTAIALAPNMPIITNSSDAANGGNGVVVIGDAIIERIYFQDTWASAINYDQGRNLFVKEVLVTGHNQGEVTTPTAEGVEIEVAGINGQTIVNGKTVLKKIIIRNNHTGSGILDASSDGAQRELLINKCEIAELTTVLTSPNVGHELIGIGAFPFGVGTNLKVNIQNASLHDFKAQVSSVVYDGLKCASRNGGSLKGLINNCSFYHIGDPLLSGAFHIHAQSTSTGGHEDPSTLKLAVESCRFEEPQENTLIQNTAVQLDTENSKTKLSVKNSTVINVFDNFVTFLDGNGTQKVELIGNTGSGFEVFYAALTQASSNPVSNPQKITQVLIKDNTFRGGDNFGAIAVLPNLDGNSTPWDSLQILAKGNCFDGQGSGFAGLIGFDFGSGGAGNATITAHKNSIVGFTFDIADFNANVNYFAQRNWWGPGNSCAAGADCASTQICSNGFCTGPDNVLNLGTGIVDVSDPLDKSIECLQKCFFPFQESQNSINVFERKDLSEKKLDVMELLEWKKEKFKERHS